MTDSPLNSALRQFEVAEANLNKTEKVLDEIEGAIPSGIAFVGEDPEYEANCRSFYSLLQSLPKIDGWKPDIILMDLDGIAQNRLDAQEIGEISCCISVEREIGEPARLLREYRYRFNLKRRELIRDSLIELIDEVDANLRELKKLLQQTRQSKIHSTINLRKTLLRLIPCLGAASQNQSGGQIFIAICISECLETFMTLSSMTGRA